MGSNEAGSRPKKKRRAYEESIEIGAPSEAVFDLIHDYSMRLKWDPREGPLLASTDQLMRKAHFEVDNQHSGSRCNIATR